MRYTEGMGSPFREDRLDEYDKDMFEALDKLEVWILVFITSIIALPVSLLVMSWN
jgi:hypothetical protein